MSIMELESKAREIKELKIMKDEIDAEIEALQDEIKAEMGKKELIIAGPYKIHWTATTSSRVDTTALKEALPDIAKRFMKTSTSRRFSIN